MGGPTSMIKALALVFLLFPLMGLPLVALTCDDLGQPTFTATRIISLNGQVLSQSQVYVAPGWGEREERTLPNGEQDVLLLLGDGTYMYNEDKNVGVFIPRPSFPEPSPGQVSSVMVGANTRYSELGRGGEGEVGDVLLCSPEGVPLRREFSAMAPNGQFQRIEMEHRNVVIMSLPRNLFHVPPEVHINVAK